ncbi:amidohydrolase family protein [Streptomyces sp. NPDC091292]|uniref:amidohydrolase family protein n=1 Tax=Streptomyces sp. NPDC091292 TaxID=3365991 RepID=UPI0037FA5FDF
MPLSVETPDPDRPVGRDHPSLDAIKGIPVIDVDTHLTEPGDLWTSRAPTKYKDLVPRVSFLDGADFYTTMGWTRDSDKPSPVWVVEEDIALGFAGGGSVINKDNEKVKGSEFIKWPLTDVSPGATFVEPRLEMMDDVGVLAQIVYPNAVGFGGQGFAKIKDPELRLLCLTIWNDVMVEMQQQSGGRLFGMGIVPWWDIDLAVGEVERIHSLGIRGVNLNADPQNQGLPELSDSYYTPMWDAISALDLPVNFHIGASVSQTSYSGTGPWPSMTNDQKIAVGSSLMYMSNSRIITNFIYSGLLDRHPKLKVVSVESGVGWLPFLLTALDYQADENNVDNLKLKPSDYFRRQIYGCFWFEEGEQMMQDVERVGVDNCMFETDFPHPTCLYPQPLHGIAKTFADTDAPWETRRKLLGSNAARVYNIDLPDHV